MKDTPFISRKIAMALAYQNITQAELAKRIGTSPASFSQRMERGTWRYNDLVKIADAINMKVRIEFYDEDVSI